ncbi:MAG TPA: DUF3301 domain-containing protein [Sulfuriferula sp.]|nr:DUF3301 domain-containing protein [Sulfuriferula sp.]
MIELVFVAALGALAWFWLDSLKTREIAIAAAKRACSADAVQLLDDTVAMASIRLARNSQGQVALRRFYRFEFSDNGDNRRGGVVLMLGSAVETVRLGNVWTV